MLSKYQVVSFIRTHGISILVTSFRIERKHVNSYLYAGKLSNQYKENEASAYMKNSNYDKALETLKRGMLLDPKNPHIHYNYACYYSLTGQPKRSLEMLKAAIHFGSNKSDQPKIDPALQKLRQSPEFKRWFIQSRT